MPGLSFIALIAYDYRYAFQSIRSYYDIADEILLGIDVERLSWTRQPYQIDMRAIEDFIAQIDAASKVRIVEGNFHRDPDPLVNDTEERSSLSREARPGNWIVQIDADEILLNASEFRGWLLSNNPCQYCICGRWITVFKSFGDHMLLIDPAEETTPVGTMLRGGYVRARVTSEPQLLSPLKLLHFSWGRSRKEVIEKLTNWSHSRDLDTARFLRFWESVNLENYRSARDFHPHYGPTWHALKLVKLAPAAGQRPG